MSLTICRDDFKRRWMLFKYLVQSVMSYGIEIWGWQKRKELEKIMLDYVRWVFRLDFCTPRYIIRRELGLNKFKREWGIRALGRFEERIRKRNDDTLVKKCWLEKESGEKKDLYSQERESFYNSLGWGLMAIEDMRNNEVKIEELIKKRNEDIQR